MTVRLTIDRARWWGHVTDVADAVDGLIPVVKGNGYGIGRLALADLAAELSPIIAVGTVHELDGLPDRVVPVVLTPTLAAPSDEVPVLTVASQAHIDALEGWHGRVIVKLESNMRRYGGTVDLVRRAHDAGLRTVGVAIHPPTAGSDEDHRDQVVRLLPQIDPSLDVWVSHLAPTTYASLPTTHRYRLRVGTYLWHGDREALRLQADVLDTRRVDARTPAGYHQVEVPGNGTLVMVGAGTANGVTTLPDGRSPFHHIRRRIDLVEPPHMHTSMLYIPFGQKVPDIGEWIDVQRPLTMTEPDVVVWT